MTICIAAIEVSHWHALNDAAYLRHLVATPVLRSWHRRAHGTQERTTCLAEDLSRLALDPRFYGD